MTTDQTAKAGAFSALHVKGNPVVLFNIWDPGSARAVEAAGAKALATGSWPVAAAFGYADGENIPLDLALDNIRRIVAKTELPVTMDLEGGYGVSPHEVEATVAKALEAGTIGINFEDQVVGGEGLHPVSVQIERVKAARKACDDAGIPGFINARTDIFLKNKPDTHTKAMLDEAITRAKAYADAGANGFFAPGLADAGMIETLCAQVSLPVNVMALPGAPEKTVLAQCGVARISYGPVPYRQMMASLGAAAKAAFA